MNLRFFSKHSLFYLFVAFCFFLDARSSSAQYQGTPPLFEFRSGSSTTYKKLYFFSSDSQRLDMSTYYFTLKSGEFSAPLDTLILDFPDQFYKRFASSELKLCIAKPGGVFSHSNNCSESLPIDVTTDSKTHRISIKLNKQLNASSDYAIMSRIPNPPTSGMYQLNLLGGLGDSLSYLGSWLVIIN